MSKSNEAPKAPAKAAAEAPKAPAKAAAKRATTSAAPDGIGPSIPEGYKPVGEVVELSRGDSARVVSDDVRVWKEAL